MGHFSCLGGARAFFASEPLLTSCVHLLSMERTSSILQSSHDGDMPEHHFCKAPDRGANDLLDESECIHVQTLGTKALVAQMHMPVHGSCAKLWQLQTVYAGPQFQGRSKPLHVVP